MAERPPVMTPTGRARGIRTRPCRRIPGGARADGGRRYAPAPDDLPGHDELDALAHGVNVLVGELGWATARAVEAHEERAVIAERANVSKNVFLRNMSHEIRTPIAAMLGIRGSARVGRPHASRTGRSLLRRLQANALAVLSLLDDLLDLAKLDAHKIVLNPEPVSVIELVRGGVRQPGNRQPGERPRDASRSARPDARHDSDRPLSTSPDPGQPRGQRRQVHRRWPHRRRLEREARCRGERWTIDITDTGIGIPADRHPYLFEPFEQVDASIAQDLRRQRPGPRALPTDWPSSSEVHSTLLHSAPGEGTAFRLIVKPLAGGARKPNPRRRARRPGAALSRGPAHAAR